MTKQKKGFWVFLFSLIPGAGEMYMGFRKQGISIMMIFWSTIAVASAVGMGWIIMFLPVLWFYSFFNVHNLKSLTEEEFYSVEDTYILHLDQLMGDLDSLSRKHRNLIAILLIVFGTSILWNCFTNLMYWILPSYIAEFLSRIGYAIPQVIIAVAIVTSGIYILTGKKKSSGNSPADNEEHYWAPYRPFQAAENLPEAATDTGTTESGVTESTPMESNATESGVTESNPMESDAMKSGVTDTNPKI